MSVEIRQALKKLTNLTLKSSMARITLLIKKEVEDGIERDFNSEISPKTGQKWAPNNPLYKKLAKPAGAKILEKTGALKRSIRVRIQGNKVVKKTALRYARVHQFGAQLKNVRIAKIGGGYLFFKKLNIPARPFIEFSTDTLRNITAKLNKAVK